jgi:processive 1,2-diacylglycerol beta-glucosyltransferase
MTNLPEKHMKARGPKVLLVSATVGSGHNTAAKAILAALKQARPHLDIEFVDTLDYMPRWFRAYYAQGFALSMTHFGPLYGLGFKLTDRPQKPRRSLGERLRLWHEFRAARRFREMILDKRPDLVVNTHFVAAPIIGRLQGRGQLDTRQLTVVTDIQVHRWWYSPCVERYFLPHPFSARRLEQWGLGPDRYTVSGIPLRPAWSEPVDEDTARAEWRIPAGRRLVLLSGGTEFTVGPIRRIARGVARACPDAYVAVLAGRNKKLLGQIAAMPQTPEKIVGIGFTDRIHELVQLADLMITKAGGITTAECLSKGTPMVLMNPVPGQEGGNARFLAGEGAAVIARGTRQIVETTAKLLAERSRLRELSANARGLYRPGTEIIVQAILDAVDSKPCSTSEG